MWHICGKQTQPVRAVRVKYAPTSLCFSSFPSLRVEGVAQEPVFLDLSPGHMATEHLGAERRFEYCHWCSVALYNTSFFFLFLNYITSSYQFVTSRLGHNHPYTVKTVRVCFADNNNNHTIWCSLSKWFSELQINALKHSEMAGSNLTPKSKD